MIPSLATTHPTTQGIAATAFVAGLAAGLGLGALAVARLLGAR